MCIFYSLEKNKMKFATTKSYYKYIYATLTIFYLKIKTEKSFSCFSDGLRKVTWEDEVEKKKTCYYSEAFSHSEKHNRNSSSLLKL